MEKIKTWNYYHALVLALSSLGICLGIGLQLSVGVAVISFAYFIALHWTWMKQQRPFGGFAFWLTFLRLVLILILAWHFASWEPMVIFWIALVAMLADGVDGWLARHFQTESDFGAYLDMESDAFFVCTMSTILYLNHYFGAWILAIGFLRYAYVLLIYLLRQDHKKEGPNRYATPIAGFLFISLLTPFVLEASWYEPIVGLASALVCLSFGYGFSTLWRVD
ncbi:MAG: CDP-alcohol phosphatidyltransferase family protein [Saprospiraceae bacterium]